MCIAIEQSDCKRQGKMVKSVNMLVSEEFNLFKTTYTTCTYMTVLGGYKGDLQNMGNDKGAL